MATRQFILGHHCALYYVPAAQRTAVLPDCWANMVGTKATAATFVLVEKIGDVTVDTGGNMVEVPTRSGRGWKQSVNAQKNGDITFQMVWTPESQICQDFMRANITSCPIAVAALDGSLEFKEGGGLNTNPASHHPFSPCAEATVVMGLWGDFTCTMTQSQPLNNLVLVDVSLTPTIGQISPEWVSYSTTIVEDWEATAPCLS